MISQESQILSVLCLKNVPQMLYTSRRTRWKDMRNRISDFEILCFWELSLNFRKYYEAYFKTSFTSQSKHNKRFTKVSFQYQIIMENDTVWMVSFWLAVQGCQLKECRLWMKRMYSYLSQLGSDLDFFTHHSSWYVESEPQMEELLHYVIPVSDEWL
jgi:hypothetical protein